MGAVTHRATTLTGRGCPCGICTGGPLDKSLLKSQGNRAQLIGSAKGPLHPPPPAMIAASHGIPNYINLEHIPPRACSGNLGNGVIVAHAPAHIFEALHYLAPDAQDRAKQAALLGRRISRMSVGPDFWPDASRDRHLQNPYAWVCIQGRLHRHCRTARGIEGGMNEMTWRHIAGDYWCPSPHSPEDLEPDEAGCDVQMEYEHFERFEMEDTYRRAQEHQRETINTNTDRLHAFHTPERQLGHRQERDHWWHQTPESTPTCASPQPLPEELEQQVAQEEQNAEIEWLQFYIEQALEATATWEDSVQESDHETQLDESASTSETREARISDPTQRTHNKSGHGTNNLKPTNHNDQTAQDWHNIQRFVANALPSLQETLTMDNDFHLDNWTPIPAPDRDLIETRRSRSPRRPRRRRSGPNEHHDHLAKWCVDNEEY